MENIKILVFILNNELYALDIMEIERILAYDETTKIPEMPSFIDGVMDYDGVILPVINLAKKFKLDCTGIKENSKVIVTKCDSKKIAIIVDGVSEVIEVKEEDIEENSGVAKGVSNKYVKGLIKLNGEIVIFLDMKFVLSEEEIENLDM